MNFLYFIVGMLTGVSISVLNVLAYKKEVQERFRKMTTKKSVVIDMSNPLDELPIDNQ